MDNCNLTLIVPNIIKNVCFVDCNYTISNCYCECVNKYLDNDDDNNDNDDDGNNNHILINRVFAWLCICTIFFSYCLICVKCKTSKPSIKTIPIYEKAIIINNSNDNNDNNDNNDKNNNNNNNDNTNVNNNITPAINKIETLPNYNDINTQFLLYTNNQMPPTYNKSCNIPLD